jgi:hypothetical protein
MIFSVKLAIISVSYDVNLNLINTPNILLAIFDIYKFIRVGCKIIYIKITAYKKDNRKKTIKQFL